MKADWVVLTGCREPFAKCERCRTTLLVKLPMRLPAVAKLMLAFARQHQGCPAPTVPNK